MLTIKDLKASVEEKQILKGIRKFSDTTVKQVMRTRLDVNGIEYSASFSNTIKKIESLQYSRLPVYKNSLDECNLDICNIFDIINICNSKYKTHFYFYDENIYCRKYY